MSNYFTERDKNNFYKICKIVDEDLPEFCREFFLALESHTTTMTRLAYAYDLKLFFRYLVTECTQFLGRHIKELQIVELETLPSIEIEKYISYLTYYTNSDDDVCKNSNRGKARKLSAIRTMFKYFIKKEYILRDPTAAVEPPRIKDKEIIRLESDEIERMLSVTENGIGLTIRQQKYHESTRVRDTAIIGFLLGTGIRVSELVGLNLKDIDFESRSFVITRKGGNRVQLYFNEEVGGLIYEYYLYRIADKKIPATETALFVSLQNTRISQRTVENIVKKYSSIATPQKRITPHKLRSTFGTQLYKETGDIYIVADVLGHKDVNTTKKHYAAISDDARRKAALQVKLRSDSDKKGE